MLTERELARRGQELDGQSATCPDCGPACPCSAVPDSVLLTGPRGSLAYTQPKHYCDRCRRSFFPEPASYEPPKLLAREVIASGQDAEQFGWHLEARAWQLGFPAAERQAFVADGPKTNWSIQQKDFPRAVPIVDLMHALSYAWAAAAAIEGASYRQWAEWIWRGKVSRVLSGEAVLQLRADSISDTRPLTGFWQRWQAQPTGSKRYQSAV